MKPLFVIISIIAIGVVGIAGLVISIQESEIDTNKISNSNTPIYPIQLQKVIDSCKNLDTEINVRFDTEWSNGTHFINNDVCKWQENTISADELTEDQLIDIKLNKFVLQNLVKNLIEKYDKEGIENLHQADFVNRLSGEKSSFRYLFIIDPLTDIIIAHPRELNNNLPREILVQNSNSYYNLIDDSDNENGFWFKETFKVKNSEVSFDQLLWIVPHDDLIFLSGYVIDKDENAFN